MSAEPAAESSLVGQTFDNKFRIVRLIGRGGMGEVFEAEHTQLGKRVAVKLMLEKYTGDKEAVARFTRESRAAGRIGDPHIIDVMDIGTAPDGRAYVVMELLQGQPLSRLIEDHGALPVPRALRIMRQVLRAVGAAHAKGIVHRDLKPDNIFLTQQGEAQDFVKLLDFGISKIIDPETQMATKLTTTGVVMGTPLYMAPEQAMGNEIDHLADLYACGVIFYEMLAGRPPFEGQTYAVLVAKLLTTDAPLLSDLRPELPPRLVAAVHRALEKEPKARFSSAETFLQALPASQSGSPVELAGTIASGPQVAVAMPGRSRKNVWFALGAGLLGVALGTGIIVKMTAAPAPAVEAPVKPDTPPPVPAVTRFDFRVSPPEARVILDDKTDRTYGNGDGVVVTPGPHKIRVELDGYEPQFRDEMIAEGTTKPVSFALIPVKKAVADVAKPEPAKKEGKRPTPKQPATIQVTAPVKQPDKAADKSPDKMIEKTVPDGSDGYTPPPPIKKEPTVKKQPTTVEPDRKPNPY